MEGNSNNNNLVKDVLPMFLGGAVITMIGYFFWLPDLLMMEDDLVQHMVRSVFLHVYLPSVVLFFVLTVVTNNIGQVDKVWSVMPMVCCWYLTYLHYQWNGFKDVNNKYLLMSGLVTSWTCKMVVGFWRRGGIHFPCVWRGHEDYRWSAIREKVPFVFNNPLLSTCFNLGFICGYQLFHLCYFSGAVFAMCVAKDRIAGREGFTVYDILIMLLMAVLMVVEHVADRQQQHFQTQKHKWLSLQDGEEKKSFGETSGYELGFLTYGLFAYSRHPNYLCEQAIWVTFYMFTIDFGNLGGITNDITTLFTIGGVFNITSVGFILLLLMFDKSTDLTEQISSAKYKGYPMYQQNVPKFIDVGGLTRRFCFGTTPDDGWKNQLKQQ